MQHRGYRIIDLKGVIGPVIFDIPRYILNEYYYDKRMTLENRYIKINRIIEYFEQVFNIPKSKIKQSFFVEMAMAACWQIEDGLAPDIQDIVFAEKVMNS